MIEHLEEPSSTLLGVGHNIGSYKCHALRCWPRVSSACSSGGTHYRTIQTGWLYVPKLTQICPSGSTPLKCVFRYIQLISIQHKKKYRQYSQKVTISQQDRQYANTYKLINLHRPEERSVGKECRSRWWPYHKKKTSN